MAEINRAVKGTCDLLPENSYKWQFVEKFMLDTARLYGFKEIRVPVFEHTEVFKRSVGDTTDVVQKEMYTFDDKGGRSITLRPELTAGVVRSAIENGLVNGALPLKVCYIGGCYRYEKPQAGRLREFHQFGIECFGAAEPAADAEVIALGKSVLGGLGVKNLSLQINSIGCPTCRAKYHEALKAYFSSKKDELCATCLDRLDRNPMRILDCKSPVCSEIAKDAPVMLDFLCDDCKEHFEGVKKHLTSMDIEYNVNPHIVRGLDYYTRTVFEFVSNDIGAQGTVCGGGRYDGLVSQMGGPALPALGFGMGIERLMLVLENQGVELPAPEGCDLFIATMGSDAAVKASGLCARLREEGFAAQCELGGRGVKAQMRYANKLGSAFTMVIGEDELKNGSADIKNMETGESRNISFENIVDEFYSLKQEKALSQLTDAIAE